MSFDYVRAGKYFLLADFFIGMKLGLKYFFKPKATLNYPHEKAPYLLVLEANMRFEDMLMVKRDVLLVSCVKQYVLLKLLQSMQNHVKTDLEELLVMISI